MSNYLISYDLQSGHVSPHKPFLTAAAKEGLIYVLQSANFINRLPNTTLWGVFARRQAAVDAFNRAKTAAEIAIRREIVVEKRLVSLLDDWLVSSDLKKTPDPRWTGATTFETSRLHQMNDPFFA